MTAVVDYGVGNVGAILNMLKRVDPSARIASDRDSIANASRLILPGVGAFDTGMRKLRESGLAGPLAEAALGRGTPILGICLGMQMLAEASDEGSEPGLGWIPARCRRFDPARVPAPARIPHMGWNGIAVARDAELVRGLPDAPRFYFVHSYHLECRSPADVVATTEYGYPFPSVIQRGNVCGTQFHPEKSHRFGLALLANFARSAAAVPE